MGETLSQLGAASVTRPSTSKPSNSNTAVRPRLLLLQLPGEGRQVEEEEEEEERVIFCVGWNRDMGLARGEEGGLGQQMKTKPTAAA